jgi:hypothetical protein
LAIRLGLAAKGPTRIYLTGGASAVLEGWRGSTADVDLRFEPDLDEMLRELPGLKESLGVNIELASRSSIATPLSNQPRFVRRSRRRPVSCSERLPIRPQRR